MANVVVWADIPVVDLNRAKAFYEKLLGTSADSMPGFEGIALLRSPGESGQMDVSADLAPSDIKPSTTHGTTIYLSSFGDIDGMLERATQAGGRILSEKSLMENVGWMAFIEDSEGNRIGIHQPG
jgi:predicted enzyme related to lactoylglutathione lyase